MTSRRLSVCRSAVMVLQIRETRSHGDGRDGHPRHQVASDRVESVLSMWRFLQFRRLGPVLASRYLNVVRRVSEDLAIPLKDLHIVVLIDEGSSLERDLQRPDGAGDVEFIDVRGDAAAVVGGLRRRARPDVIVDATSQGDRLKLFRDAFWALKDGGRYVALNAGARWSRGMDALLQPIDSGTVAAARRRRELIDSVAGHVNAVHRRDWIVFKRQEHHAVLRHSDVEETLADRFGDQWGTVLVRQEAYEYASRADVVMHGEPSNATRPAVIEVPQLAVREYRGVTCHMREIVTRENLILPDTYRHWQSKNLFHKRIQAASSSYGRLTDAVVKRETRFERGTFYSLDSAFPTHFGHLMTETISKYWGWQLALKSYPGIRPIMTHQAGKPSLPAWKSDVLRALGIPVDDILFVRSGDSVKVDGLVAAMPQLVNPHYIDLNINQTWEAISSGIGPDPAARDRPEKIFLSRRQQAQRTCSNSTEVEAFFASQGFTILLPEELSFAEQVHIFAGARIIAGFGGSALFNAMFNSTAKVLVLTSQSYVAANEYLIASANGNELHYFWAPPLIEQPRTGFSVDAYRSGFEFPVERHRAALLDAIG